MSGADGLSMGENWSGVRSDEVQRWLVQNFETCFGSPGDPLDPFTYGTNEKSISSDSPTHPDWFMSPQVTATVLKQALLTAIKRPEARMRQQCMLIFNELTRHQHGPQSDILHLKNISSVELSQRVAEFPRCDLSHRVEELSHILLMISWKLDSSVTLRIHTLRMARKQPEAGMKEDQGEPRITSLEESIVQIRQDIHSWAGVLILAAFTPPLMTLVELKSFHRQFISDLSHVFESGSDSYPWWECFIFNFRNVLQETWKMVQTVAAIRFQPFMYPKTSKHRDGVTMNKSLIPRLPPNQCCKICHKKLKTPNKLFPIDYGYSRNSECYPRECLYHDRDPTKWSQHEDISAIRLSVAIVCSSMCLLHSIRSSSPEMNTMIATFEEALDIWRGHESATEALSSSGKLEKLVKKARKLWDQCAYKEIKYLIRSISPFVLGDFVDMTGEHTLKFSDTHDRRFTSNEVDQFEMLLDQFQAVSQVKSPGHNQKAASSGGQGASAMPSVSAATVRRIKLQSDPNHPNSPIGIYQARFRSLAKRHNECHDALRANLTWQRSVSASEYKFNETDWCIEVVFCHHAAFWPLLVSSEDDYSALLRSRMGENGTYTLFPAPFDLLRYSMYRNGLRFLVRPREVFDCDQLVSILKDNDCLMFGKNFNVIERTCQGGFIYRDGDTFHGVAMENMFKFLLGTTNLGEIWDQAFPSPHKSFAIQKATADCEKGKSLPPGQEDILSLMRQAMMVQSIQVDIVMVPVQFAVDVNTQEGKTCRISTVLSAPIGARVDIVAREFLSMLHTRLEHVQLEYFLPLKRKKNPKTQTVDLSMRLDERFVDLDQVVHILVTFKGQERLTWDAFQYTGSRTSLKFNQNLGIARVTTSVTLMPKGITTKERLVLLKSTSIKELVVGARLMLHILDEVSVEVTRVYEEGDKDGYKIQSLDHTLFDLEDIEGQESISFTIGLVVDYTPKEMTPAKIFDRSLCPSEPSLDTTSLWMGVVQISQMDQRVNEERVVHMQVLLEDPNLAKDKLLLLDQHLSSWEDFFGCFYTKGTNLESQTPFISLKVVLSPIWEDTWLDLMSVFISMLESRKNRIPLIHCDGFPPFIQLRFHEVSRSFVLDLFKIPKNTLSKIQRSSTRLGPRIPIRSGKKARAVGVGNFDFCGMPAFVTLTRSSADIPAVLDAGLVISQFLTTANQEMEICTLIPINLPHNVLGDLEKTPHLSMDIHHPRNPTAKISWIISNWRTKQWTHYLVYFGRKNPEENLAQRLFLAKAREGVTLKLLVLGCEDQAALVQFARQNHYEADLSARLIEPTMPSEDWVAWRGRLIFSPECIIPGILTSSSQYLNPVLDRFQDLKFLEDPLAEDLTSLESELWTVTFLIDLGSAPPFIERGHYLTALKAGVTFVCLDLQGHLTFRRSTNQFVFQLKEKSNPIPRGVRPMQVSQRLLGKITMRNPRFSPCTLWIRTSSMTMDRVILLGSEEPSHTLLVEQLSPTGFTQVLTPHLRNEEKIELDLVAQDPREGKFILNMAQKSGIVLLAVPKNFSKLQAGDPLVRPQLSGIFLQSSPHSSDLVGYMIPTDPFIQIMSILNSQFRFSQQLEAQDMGTRVGTKQKQTSANTRKETEASGGEAEQTSPPLDLLATKLKLLSDCVQDGPKLARNKRLTHSQVSRIASNYPFEEALESLGGLKRLSRQVKIKRHELDHPSAEFLTVPSFRVEEPDEAAIGALLKRVSHEVRSSIVSNRFEIDHCTTCRLEDFDLMVCSKCRLTKYCSQMCAKKDQLSHGKECQDVIKVQVSEMLLDIRKRFPPTWP